MKTLLQKFVRDTEGQDLIEYALLAAVIAQFTFLQGERQICNLTRENK